MLEDERTSPRNGAAEISRGVVRLLHEATGRGPTRARTVIGRDHVMVALEEVLTPLERTLIQSGDELTVRAGRDRVREVIRPLAIPLVEQTTGRKVASHLSAWNADPDTAVEVFLLVESD